MSATCPDCKVTWGGLLTCHCTAKGCHQTFTSIGAFDMHQTSRGCDNPNTAKKRDGSQKFAEARPGVWGQPAPTDGHTFYRAPGAAHPMKENTMTDTNIAPEMSPAKLREYAAEKGIEVAARGRIPSSVQSSFDREPKKVQRAWLKK